MFGRKLVPDSFDVPVRVETPEFVIIPLGSRCMHLDMEAVPHGDVNRHMNANNYERFGDDDIEVESADPNLWLLAMLSADEIFDLREDFYYAVLSKDEEVELGCLYVSRTPKVGYDAEIVLWVRNDLENSTELDQALSHFAQTWIDDVWPFSKAAFPGRTIEWSAWENIPDKKPSRWDDKPVRTVLVPKHLVPRDFVVPRGATAKRFHLEPLMMNKLGVDTEACLSSTTAIREQLPIVGTRWPAAPLSHERCLARIGHSVKQWFGREAFSFSIMEISDSPRALGALHIQPSRKVDFEAEVYFWVRTSELHTGLTEEILSFSKQWINDAWPFEPSKVNWPGHDQSWKQWQEIAEFDPEP